MIKATEKVNHTDIPWGPDSVLNGTPSLRKELQGTSP